MKRVPSSAGLRRPPSAGNLQTHSRNSGGSELFDALLQAATGADANGGGGVEPSHGDPPVTSRHYATAQLGRQRSSRLWASHNEVDSLQAAMDDYAEEGEEGIGGGVGGATGGGGLGGARVGSGSARRRMMRRNSVSMILENPVLAQVGAACLLQCVWGGEAGAGWVEWGGLAAFPMLAGPAFLWF
jgi:hypothetical protein